jgi:hypothetical protein
MIKYYCNAKCNFYAIRLLNIHLNNTLRTTSITKKGLNAGLIILKNIITLYYQ